MGPCDLEVADGCLNIALALCDHMGHIVERVLIQQKRLPGCFSSPFCGSRHRSLNLRFLAADGRCCDQAYLKFITVYIVKYQVFLQLNFGLFRSIQPTAPLQKHPSDCSYPHPCKGFFSHKPVSPVFLVKGRKPYHSIFANRTILFIWTRNHRLWRISLDYPANRFGHVDVMRGKVV